MCRLRIGFNSAYSAIKLHNALCNDKKEYDRIVEPYSLTLWWFWNNYNKKYTERNIKWDKNVPVHYKVRQGKLQMSTMEFNELTRFD